MANQTKDTAGRTAARRRSKGLWTAAAFALVVIGLVGFFLARAGLSGGPKRADAEVAAPDVTDPLLRGEAGRGGPGARARSLNIQLEDPENPARLKGELHAAELSPEANHRYTVKAPEAWIYLKNGWMVYVRSDTGNFYIPDDQKQPERGVLQGAVRCEGYPPHADGTRLSRRSLERSKEKPAMVATMDSMAFDSTLGTMATDSRVVVTGDELDFAGTGLKLAVNQVKEQLNLLDIARGEYLKYRPKAGSAGLPSMGKTEPEPAAPTEVAAAGSKAPPAGEGVKKGGAPQAKPGPAPLITMYLAEFSEGVVVSQGTRTAHADQLSVWARLIDNALPAGAIMDIPLAGTDPETPPSAANAASTPAVASASAPSPAGEGAVTYRPEGLPAAQPAKAAPGTTEETTLTWTGPLRIRPLETEPLELKRDHLFLRFTAEQSGLVRLADTQREMTGRCAGLEYGTTSRRLVLSGPGPSSVALAMKEFEAEAVRIEADLGAGIGKVPGPGVGRNTRSGERLSWTEQADFDFLLEKDSSGRERLVGLKTATMQGKAAMAVGDTSVTADSLRAEFLPGQDEQTTLDKVEVKGNVIATAGRNRSLTCDEGEMAFKAGKEARNPDPTSFTARGNVVATDGPSKAKSDFLTARLERAEDGSVKVTHAELKGQAHFEQDDGVRPAISADASELTADPVKRIVDLIADDGQTAKVVRGGAELTGPSIRLDGLANAAWVVGPGNFINRPDKRSPNGPAVTASWTKEMKFDDTMGILTADGRVVAEVAPDPLSLDKIRAERVRLEMTPGRGPSEGDSAGEAAAVATKDNPAEVSLDPSGGGRKMIRARAEGSIMEETDGTNATVESWRYAADKAAPGGKRPERVLYLEGPLIKASEVDGTLDVDGDGRLLVVDRRYFDGAAGTPAADDAGIAAKLGEGSVGGSLFSWMGSMHLNRAEGSIHFLERVRLNHKTQREASLMELECEELTAKVRERAAGEGADAKGVDGELESAEASGAVWARSTSRELIADRLSYDAKAGKAEAFASEGNRVTVFDRLKATTATAGRLKWDLTGDTIEIVEPGSVTAPK